MSQSTISALVNGNKGSGVACSACNAVFPNVQQAAGCLCRRRRYITTLGIRYNKVPTAAQLKALTGKSAYQVAGWYNSRLSAMQRSSAANNPAAPFQVVALQAAGLPVPAGLTVGAADAALVAWFSSSASTSALVWQVAQAVSAPQSVQLTLW